MFIEVTGKKGKFCINIMHIKTFYPNKIGGGSTIFIASDTRINDDIYPVTEDYEDIKRMIKEALM